MMKNLLIVFTVLAIASTASATMTLSVNGLVDPPQTEITIAPSDVVMIDIHNDDDNQIGLAVFLHASDGGSLSFSCDEDPIAVNVVNGCALGIIDMGTLNPAWAGIIQVDLAKPDPSFRVPVGVVADNIRFHCDTPDVDVTIDLTDSPIPGIGAILDSQIIHQVPEPVTLALLGLGGLFLRRRK
jgi:hypothetical protein